MSKIRQTLLGRRRLSLLTCVAALAVALAAGGATATATTATPAAPAPAAHAAKVATAAVATFAPKSVHVSPAAVSSSFKFPYGCPKGSTCLYLHDNAVGRNGQNEPDNEFYYCKAVNISGYTLHSGTIVNNNTGGAQAELFKGKNGTDGYVFVNDPGAYNIDLYPANSIKAC